MQRPSSTNQRGEKKTIEDKANKFIQQNPNLSTNQLIKKAAEQKKIPIPNPKKLPSSNNQTLANEVKPVEEQIQVVKQVEAIKQVDKELQLKLKEKQRECSMLNEKLKLQTHQIGTLRSECDEIKQLLEVKIKDGTNYNEKRQLQLSYTILKKQRLLSSMTYLVQQTKTIRYELEGQFKTMMAFSAQIEDQSQQGKIVKFCEKQLERLQYIEAQQLSEQEHQRENKQGQNKLMMESILKLDQSVGRIINTFDQHRNFIDSQTMNDLEAISMQLQQFVQTTVPTIKLKPLLVIVTQHGQRVAGAFSTIFPHFNNLKEVIKKQIENDVVYKQIEQVDLEVKQLSNQPISIRSINILRSLLIHQLLIIHTYNLQPKFKAYQDILKPFIIDSQQLLKQYEENEQMGAQVLWEYWKSEYKSIQDGLQQLDNEIKQMSQQYRGFWNNNYMDESIMNI